MDIFHIEIEKSMVSFIIFYIHINGTIFKNTVKQLFKFGMINNTNLIFI